MIRPQTLRALAALDIGSALGDPLLRWMAAVPLAVALAVRHLLPLAAARLSALTEADLGWVVAPLSAYAVVGIGPLIAGAVVGFLLLDQRDDRTLLALRVTPLPLGVYLAYRLAVPTLLAIAVTVAALLLAGAEGISPAEALLAAALAAPLAPLTALALLAFARNKLAGMALLKVGSLLLGAPLAALFLPPAWTPALGVVPTFWAAKVTWALQADASPWPWAVGALVLPALLGAALLWRLRRVLGGS